MWTLAMPFLRLLVIIISVLQCFKNSNAFDATGTCRSNRAGISTIRSIRTTSIRSAAANQPQLASGKFPFTCLPSNNNALAKNRQPFQKKNYARVTTLTVMHSTNNPSSNEDDSKKNKKGKNSKNPLVAVRKVVNIMILIKTLLASRFQILSKKGKLIVLAQFFAVTLILGTSAKRAVVASSTRAAKTPIEVPYSTFLDFCETNSANQKDNMKNGPFNNKKHNDQSSTNNNNNNVAIGNVVIGQDRIGYKIMRLDTEEQKEAMQQIQTNGERSTSIAIPQRYAYTRKVNASPDLIQHLRNNQIPFQAASNKNANAAAMAVRSSLLFFYLLVMIRMYRSMNGGGGGGAGGGIPGKLASKTKLQNDLPLATFDDIEGMDSAKFEVMELVDTLRNPDKYAILGARAPTGLLLEGPPGTGKTMLARATAATAGVPLLYCSGSDFVEMFVGRGAARVRKTFARAAKLAPCIVFIDELDALGKSRAFDNNMMGGRGGGNDEAEQTLNQLLACMDGLDSNKGVCVLAATNRRNVLDPALVRPGRFDRIIRVELPNTRGRENILRVHAQKLPGFKEGEGVDEKRLGSLGKGAIVDLSAVASVTQGLSGAELEFIVNEAAIRAVRRVSAQLRENGAATSGGGGAAGDTEKIIPVVTSEDFEQSVANYFETRQLKNRGVGDIMSNLMRTK